jgi:hypothetical protein
MATTPFVELSAAHVERGERGWLCVCVCKIFLLVRWARKVQPEEVTLGVCVCWIHHQVTKWCFFFPNIYIL